MPRAEGARTRAGLTPALVLDAALAVVDEQGASGLTLAAVAARTGVATPSLYKHVQGLPELRRQVVARIFDELGADLAQAVMGRSRDEAVAAVLRAYRAYAGRNPRRYAALPQEADPVLAELAAPVMEPLFAALRGFGLADGALVDAVRCLRVVAHGFASLESTGAFALPEALDHTYEQMIALFLAGLKQAFPVEA
ncbi:TetR/AcrR family transcriptional regulator [Streptacidiphilus jiangxiensis]|uniref:DNA-binding transcriptional regulator, AcrR family n=1 Tax=Streptacidiphilus jiangxiensis TaxID=235985 RepID=A0A1H7HNK6_STRJI|nr:TetR-like C-terminal domain-containing protein [Streptacidiphilus jiangxiensis]SEK49805.1 DNA-binding transcriptional regulator, AcrR family [Streptacidiphilus jiangxiensis]